MTSYIPFFKTRVFNLFKYLLFFLILSNLLRIVFLVLYYQPASPAEILLSFLIALRFDLATFFIAFAPLLLLLFFIKQEKAIPILGSVLLAMALLVFLADIFYFPEVGRRLGIEIFVFLHDFKGTLRMAFIEVWYAWLLFLPLLYALYRLVKRISHPAPWPGFSWGFFSCQLLAFVMIVCTSVIAIRGGLQSRPLRVAMAFQNDNVFLGNLALNGFYTVVQALDKQDSLPVFSRDRQKIHRAIKPFLFTQDEVSQNPGYFFSRKTTGKPVERTKNLVLLIMESWSARDLAVFGHKLNATPYFTELVRKGRLFTNFYATGQRSISSLPSILGSIPSIHGSIISTSSFQHNQQRSIASILKQQGYATYFCYAAKKTSMGFYSYARANGFEHILTREDFDANEKTTDGTWGVFDHISFTRMADLLNNESRPYLAVLYSLHPHPPFNIPVGNDFYKDAARSDFFNALRYSDYALSLFMKSLKEIENTIFIITADHAYGDKKGLERFHIPLLVYDPAKKEGSTSAVLGSQLDILPTALDLLQIKTHHAAMGKSLFAGGERRILIDYDQLMLFASPDGIIRYNRDSLNSSINWQGAPLQNQQVINRLQAEYRSYISAISLALIENKITKNY